LEVLRALGVLDSRNSRRMPCLVAYLRVVARYFKDILGRAFVREAEDTLLSKRMAGIMVGDSAGIIAVYLTQREASVSKIVK
jgi:hypothetical protein